MPTAWSVARHMYGVASAGHACRCIQLLMRRMTIEFGIPLGPACRLLQELPPESGRVLRRVLLSDASSQFEAGGWSGRVGLKWQLSRHSCCSLGLISRQVGTSAVCWHGPAMKPPWPLLCGVHALRHARIYLAQACHAGMGMGALLLLMPPSHTALSCCLALVSCCFKDVALPSRAMPSHASHAASPMPPFRAASCISPFLCHALSCPPCRSAHAALLLSCRLMPCSLMPSHAAPPCPAAAADGAKRQAVCSLLCELFLADAIPETVIFDCLEQLLWDVSGRPLGWAWLGCLAWWGWLERWPTRAEAAPCTAMACMGAVLYPCPCSTMGHRHGRVV